MKILIFQSFSNIKQQKLQFICICVEKLFFFDKQMSSDGNLEGSFVYDDLRTAFNVANAEKSRLERQTAFRKMNSNWIQEKFKRDSQIEICSRSVTKGVYIIIFLYMKNCALVGLENSVINHYPLPFVYSLG